jgi:hypothetical protein
MVGVISVAPTNTTLILVMVRWTSEPGGQGGVGAMLGPVVSCDCGDDVGVWVAGDLLGRPVGTKTCLVGAGEAEGAGDGSVALVGAKDGAAVGASVTLSIVGRSVTGANVGGRVGARGALVGTIGALVITLVGASVGSRVTKVVGSAVGSSMGASVGSFTGAAVGNVSSTLVGMGVGPSTSPPCTGETVGSNATGAMVGSSVLPCAITPVKHWKIKISAATQSSRLLIFQIERLEIRMPTATFNRAVVLLVVSVSDLYSQHAQCKKSFSDKRELLHEPTSESEGSSVTSGFRSECFVAKVCCTGLYRSSPLHRLLVPMTVTTTTTTTLDDTKTAKLAGRIQHCGCVEDGAGWWVRDAMRPFGCIPEAHEPTVQKIFLGALAKFWKFNYS